MKGIFGLTIYQFGMILLAFVVGVLILLFLSGWLPSLNQLACEIIKAFADIFSLGTHNVVGVC